jgi:hypothetical protein
MKYIFKIYYVINYNIVKIKIIMDFFNKIIVKIKITKSNIKYLRTVWNSHTRVPLIFKNSLEFPYAGALSQLGWLADLNRC